MSGAIWGGVSACLSRVLHEEFLEGVMHDLFLNDRDHHIVFRGQVRLHAALQGAAEGEGRWRALRHRQLTLRRVN